MDCLQEKINSLGSKIKERSNQQTAKIIQLPMWPEPARGIPNSALRGALFAAIQGKNRRYMKRELLTVQKGMEIRFTGMQLDQSDLDVWEQALHLARMHPLSTRCDFTAHGFLKSLGRSTGRPMHEWLKDAFARLGSCFVEITHNGKTYFGSLIEGGVRDEHTGLYVLNLNPGLVKLYGAGMWTAMDWQQRQQLRRKPLALWLHGFYASHADPHPIKIETLRQLSGSRNKDKWGFKRDLIKALEGLKAIGAILDFEIKNDLLYVKQAPSLSQKKHLAKAKLKRKKARYTRYGARSSTHEGT